LKNVHQLTAESLNSSFPSGHSTFAFALAFSIFWYDKKSGIIFIILAILVALGRVLVGVHYPLDILFGALLGFLVVRITKFFVK
jgi:undecaprenyl-diphosphatase